MGQFVFIYLLLRGDLRHRSLHRPLSFFNLGAWGALYAIGPELYPTTMRARGTGAATGFGRIASILAPLIVPPLLVFGGMPVLFALFGTAFAVAAVAALALPELKGTRLAER